MYVYYDYWGKKWVEPLRTYLACWLAIIFLVAPLIALLPTIISLIPLLLLHSLFPRMVIEPRWLYLIGWLGTIVAMYPRRIAHNRSEQILLRQATQDHAAEIQPTVEQMTTTLREMHRNMKDIYTEEKD